MFDFQCELSVIMRTRAELSSGAIARWARHALLYNCEPFRIHHSRLLYPPIAPADWAFETIVAIRVVTGHLITPFWNFPGFAATFRIYRGSCQALLVRP